MPSELAVRTVAHHLIHTAHRSDQVTAAVVMHGAIGCGYRPEPFIALTAAVRAEVALTLAAGRRLPGATDAPPERRLPGWPAPNPWARRNEHEGGDDSERDRADDEHEPERPAGEESEDRENGEHPPTIPLYSE